MLWYILSSILVILLAVIFIVLIAKSAEESETRHTEPGQGKSPQEPTNR